MNAEWFSYLEIMRTCFYKNEVDKKERLKIPKNEETNKNENVVRNKKFLSLIMGIY